METCLFNVCTCFGETILKSSKVVFEFKLMTYNKRKKEKKETVKYTDILVIIYVCLKKELPQTLDSKSYKF